MDSNSHQVKKYDDNNGIIIMFQLIIKKSPFLRLFLMLAGSSNQGPQLQAPCHLVPNYLNICQWDLWRDWELWQYQHRMLSP